MTHINLFATIVFFVILYSYGIFYYRWSIRKAKELIKLKVGSEEYKRLRKK
ncbi:hypothetical protein DFR81_1059 [Garciella nitratireducens]|nr:hypothetical protein DFR81_1059 [Garciella nitratireducens]